MNEKSQPLETRVPLGESLAWTDQDLDALSEVSDQDVLEAQNWVKTNAEPEGAALWEATPQDET